VQLLVNPRKDPARTFLQNPYLILTARLIRKGDDDQDEQAGPKENDLTGTLVSSLYSLKDTDNSQGGFFVFGDLSVRRVGTYRLAFILYELKLAEKECWLLSRTVSDPFVVYATKTFPGLAESTFLTRSFSDQGVRLRLRKDSRTVSTKKRTIGQADQIQGSPRIHMHGYLPHDGSHPDLISPNGHSPHPLRRLSSLHDPNMGPGQLDRSRGSLSSQASYYADSPQLRSATGDYTAGSYGYATTTTTTPYEDHKPPYKRARMSIDGGASPDDNSPHHPGSGYDTDTTSYGHHPYSHAGPRTVPDSLTSLYSVPTTATTTSTTTGYPALTMPSPYASMHHHMSLPRLDTSSNTISSHHHHNHHHPHTSHNPNQNHNNHTSQHLPQHSPAAGSASTPHSAHTTAATFSPGGGGGSGASRRSPATAYHPYSSAHHAAAMFASGGSLPYHPAAGHHYQQLNGLGIVNALPGLLELDGGGGAGGGNGAAGQGRH
jgi:hypothetical protein